MPPNSGRINFLLSHRKASNPANILLRRELSQATRLQAHSHP